MSNVDAVQAIGNFFARHGAAGLVRPDGWFGRPHDNQHAFTRVRETPSGMAVVLDDSQTLDFTGSVTATLLRPTRLQLDGFTALDWRWTEYGSRGVSHRKHYSNGSVELVAPGDAMRPDPASVGRPEECR